MSTMVDMPTKSMKVSAKSAKNNDLADGMDAVPKEADPKTQSGKNEAGTVIPSGKSNEHHAEAKVGKRTSAGETVARGETADERMDIDAHAGNNRRRDDDEPPIDTAGLPAEAAEAAAAAAALKDTRMKDATAGDDKRGRDITTWHDSFLRSYIKN